MDERLKTKSFLEMIEDVADRAITSLYVSWIKVLKEEGEEAAYKKIAEVNNHKEVRRNVGSWAMKRLSVHDIFAAVLTTRKAEPMNQVQDILEKEND